MKLPKNLTFGLPSVARNTMPSMFKLLQWGGDTSTQPQLQVNTSHQQVEQLNNDKTNEAPPTHSLSQCKKDRRKIKSVKTKYQLYQYQTVQLKKDHSQGHYEPTQSQLNQKNTSKPFRKPKTQAHLDLAQLLKRKQRIKQFQLLTRDLPNSSSITYYGKPAFQAYGRCSSNANLKTHNVMPHKGNNHPKQLQTYYSALIKATKLSCKDHIPRNSIEEPSVEIKQEKEHIIVIPMVAPDLVNHVRFASQQPKSKAQLTIPSNKVFPRALSVKQLKTKKTEQKKQKSRQLKSKAKSKVVIIPDGLKFMNVRQNLISLMQKKKVNGSKLAYKITECYPYEWQDYNKLLETRTKWSHIVPAGLPHQNIDSVADLISCKKSP